MKKAREFVCDIAPGCRHQAAVVIHPTYKALQRAFQSAEGHGSGEVEGFCSVREEKDDRLVTLHFCKKFLVPSIVAHEAYHAVTEMIRVNKLVLADDSVEEFAACAIEHLVNEILK